MFYPPITPITPNQWFYSNIIIIVKQPIPSYYYLFLGMTTSFLDIFLIPSSQIYPPLPAPNKLLCCSAGTLFPLMMLHNIYRLILLQSNNLNPRYSVFILTLQCLFPESYSNSSPSWLLHLYCGSVGFGSIQFNFIFLNYHPETSHVLHRTRILPLPCWDMLNQYT